MKVSRVLNALALVAIAPLAAGSVECQLAAEKLTPEALVKRFGIQVEELDGRYQLKLTTGASSELLFSVSGNSEALAEAESRLARLVSDRMSAIEERFRVRIARDGEETHYSPFDDDSETVRTRAPRLDELVALEAALERSQPAQLIGRGAKGEGVSVYFLRDLKESSAAADWSFDDKKRPAVFIEPTYYIRVEKPLRKSAPDLGNQTLEAILVHELAHNSAYRLGLNLYFPERWPILRRLGWKHFWDSRTGDHGWIVKSKETPPRYYREGRLKGTWVVCNKNGGMLREDGTVTRRQREAVTVTPEAVRTLAAVPPVTDYFPNPIEVHAEALMLYRMGGALRRRLEAESPVLYEIAREADKQDIDYTFGPGRFRRGDDGKLVETAAAAK